MTAKGSCRKAHTTDVALHPMMLCGGIDCSVLLRVVPLFCIGYTYIPRDAWHDFCFVRVHPEADAFKQSHENIEGTLQPDGVS